MPARLAACGVTDPTPRLGQCGSSVPRVLGSSDSPSGYEGHPSGPEHEDQSHQKSGRGWNQISARSSLPTAHPRPTPTPLLHYCSCTGIPLQGLALIPYPPGPCSGSYRSAEGHQPALQKQKQTVVKRQPAWTFFQNKTSAGGRGWGGVGVFLAPAPRGPGVPTGT